MPESAMPAGGDSDNTPAGAIRNRGIVAVAKKPGGRVIEEMIVEQGWENSEMQ
jgi:hypothetical protein